MATRSIAIAGCGIAGLACAALLARDGEQVTVFDRLEKPQPLGSGLILQPVGLAVLDQIGVGVRLRELGAPVRRLFGRVCPSNRVVLDVRKPDGWSNFRRIPSGPGASQRSFMLILRRSTIRIAMSSGPSSSPRTRASRGPIRSFPRAARKSGSTSRSGRTRSTSSSGPTWST